MAFSDYIAAGSLLVAVIALVKSFLSDRKIKKLDVQLKERVATATGGGRGGKAGEY